MQPQQPITLRDSYPHFSDEQLKEAEANLERYLVVMIRIAERLRNEGYDLTAPDLTPSAPGATVPDVKVEFPNEDY
jgi:hypothetical protein